MAYLSAKELEAYGFKSIGKNVLISNRAAIYNPDQITIGDHSRIDDFCVVSGKVSIGRNVHLAVFCNIAGGEEGVTIEDFASLAYGCHVFSQSDDYSGRSMTNPTIPDIYKEETKIAVHIERHCIIGTNSIIFPGVTLREGTAVGALSMITTSTQPWTVYFGAPAVKIKPRSRLLLEKETELLKNELNE